MFSARVVTVFALATTVGFAVANCGGSDSSSSNGLTCANSNGTGACSAEQNKAYGDCIQSKCDGAYQMCFGSGYKGGSFGGPCGPWITCYAKCNCDKTCQGMCGLPPGECSTCLGGPIGQCVASSGCTPPTCTGGGTGGTTGGTGGTTGGGTGGSGGGGAGGSSGGSGTCADLMKCCANATNAQIKAACQSQYDALKTMQGADAACGQLAGYYKMSGYCTY